MAASVFFFFSLLHQRTVISQPSYVYDNSYGTVDISGAENDGTQFYNWTLKYPLGFLCEAPNWGKTLIIDMTALTSQADLVLGIGTSQEYFAVAIPYDGGMRIPLLEFINGKWVSTGSKDEAYSSLSIAPEPGNPLYTATTTLEEQYTTDTDFRRSLIPSGDAWEWYHLAGRGNPLYGGPIGQNSDELKLRIFGDRTQDITQLTIMKNGVNVSAIMSSTWPARQAENMYLFMGMDAATGQQEIFRLFEIKSIDECTEQTIPTAPTTTISPTKIPSLSPTNVPTSNPTIFPTANTKSPSSFPTTDPSQPPSIIPSNMPSSTPTFVPTLNPTQNPIVPTLPTTAAPSEQPSSNPSEIPSNLPTLNPSEIPTSSPISTANPSNVPTVNPTISPVTFAPTTTINPTLSPTNDPLTSAPSLFPTNDPVSPTTSAPTKAPTYCVCAALFDPVCCSGIEYSNQCEANCDGYRADDCSANACGDCVCIDFYFPYCCNGQTMSNGCNAECNGFNTGKQCSQGECKVESTTTSTEGCVCTEVEDPVCCDGTLFGNSCKAKCDGGFVADKDCTPGECVNNGNKGNSMYSMNIYATVASILYIICVTFN